MDIDELKVVVATFNGDSKTARTHSVCQYDVGRILKIEGLDLPSAYQVHMSNSQSEDAYIVLGDANGAPIPDELLATGKPLYSWVYLNQGDVGLTMYCINTYVVGRSRPPELDPDPEKVTVIDQAINSLNNAAKMLEIVEDIEPIKRISSLNETKLSTGTIIEAVGIPVFVSDISQYSDYGITDTGWYVFVRVDAPVGISDITEPTITGASGYSFNDTFVKLAIRFETDAQSVPVSIEWTADKVDYFTFKATDLAIRNLDYRTTFYVYDLSRYTTWEYALTTDAKFVANKSYFTKDGDTYTKAEVTVDEEIPADAYYTHSKVIFEGMSRNITYVLNETIDCPQIFVLPEIEDDTHGCWFEFRFRHSGSFSSTLQVPEGVKIATEHTQAETAGLNMVDLHYNNVDGVKIWRFMNTHSTIPA